MTSLTVYSDPDQMVVNYNAFCKACKLHQDADEVCEPGIGRNDADIMVISRMPNTDRYQDMIEAALIEAGVELQRCFFTSVFKCRNWAVEGRKREIKACSELYLLPEIEAIKPKFILLFGNEALSAVTGHSGITNYRGKVIEKHGAKVIPTVSPAAVQRSPMQKPAWIADLAFFGAQANGVVNKIASPKAAYIDDKAKLVKLKKRLMRAELLSYDIETAGELGSDDGGIVSLAGTYILDGKASCFFIPLDHPESCWRRIWIRVLAFLAPVFKQIPRQVAHNGKFDAKWLRLFGVPAKVTFDTMLAAHLLDENRLKGLKPLCRMILGVPPWGIDTKDLRNTPLKEIFKYNVLDTWNMHHLYLELREDLIAQPRLHRIFRLMTMPANEILIGVELRGIWIDRKLLAERTKIAFDMRDQLDLELMMWVPNPDDPMEDERVLTWPKTGKKKNKWAEVNFNASNWMRWWMFEWLQFPVIDRGKTKEDDSPGDPSLAEATMVELKEMYPDHEVLKLLTERSKWQKYCSTYVSRYSEIVDEDDRIHTTFKLAGTVTGRLSSGKEDEEKITAKRDRGRGVNLQQVPRDYFIRGLFGAPPGWSFVEADFGQIEFRLAAFISRDKTALRLIREGVDVHLAMAMKMTGKPASAITKEERKAAKPVNFGYLYGMWWKKFMETAKLNYGVFFTEEEAQASRKAFFDMYPGFTQWHARQRRIVNMYGRVQSPLGRIRHLPDIYSAEKQVQQEAERQAINSPVQSMASDMNVIAMIELDRIFRELGLRAHTLGLVHDAINFEIHNDDLHIALPIIKTTMENLPLKKKFGCEIDIPISADIKVGTHWGGAKELNNTQVYDFNKYRDEFVVEREAA